MDQDDLKWKQRAIRHWYKNGDRNTKYFHTCANQRRAKNFMKKVMEEQNNIQVEVEKIEEAFLNFYTKLFTTAAPSSKT